MMGPTFAPDGRRGLGAHWARTAKRVKQHYFLLSTGHRAIMQHKFRRLLGGRDYGNPGQNSLSLDGRRVNSSTTSSL
jgi:hypothetical protein